MNVLVLGAAGKTGREVVIKALEAGHQVTAFVRSAAKVQPHTGLKIIIGDAENAEQVSAAAVSMDAVISALGHTSIKAATPLTSAMEELAKTLPAGTKVVSLTGYGVADPKDPHISLPGQMLSLLIRLMPGGLFGDGERHVAVLRASKLNWTVLRASVLTNGAAAGYQLGYYNISPRDTISRADVAAAMVSCLASSTWDKQAPMIRRDR